MVELCVRLVMAAGMLLLGVVGYAPIEIAWKSAVILGFLTGLGWLIEAKGLLNSGLAGIQAVAEALVLTFFLGGAGWLHQFGFLVLVPCLVAATRFGAPMVSMAPLVATGLIAADGFFSKSGIPSSQGLVHAVGVLAISLLLGHRRPVIAEGPREEPSVPPQLIEDGLLQVGERYRKLRDRYAELERRGRRDLIVARIAKTRGLNGEAFYAELCGALKELTGAEDLALYSMSATESVMVVRGVTETFPGEIRNHAIEVDLSKASAILREQTENAISALSGGAPLANVLLSHRGRVVGMVCAIDSNPPRLEDLRRELTAAALVVADAIDAEQTRAANLRRLAQLEILYELGSIAVGASTPATLSRRVIRELREPLGLDSMAVTFLEEGNEVVWAHEGASGKLLDCMSFFGGPGLPGWIASGHPELVLFDARQDQRCDAQASLARRIGSFAVMPLWGGTEVLGFMSAHTQTPGGIDRGQIATLRLISAELSRAFERLVGGGNGGMMPPREFVDYTSRRKGSLVLLEPLRKQSLVAAYGPAVYDEAIRKLSHQLRAKVPAGGALCRRDEGDFLVFLDTDEEFARNWANEVAATASFIALSSSDPSRRVPLALRAKVAGIASHLDQLSEESAA